MSAQKFKKSARNRKIKAAIVTILFNGLLVGGLMHGSDMNNQMLEKAQYLWKGETAEEAPKVPPPAKKKKKTRA